ncbi:restriction endonuclease subunit S [Streptomyces sp. NPDC058247]|uniref:restriction endonuclease subunit S n=1 Tax=Streptomyces sp. NPDC058247 TaxID=3346401 RepID=UPI0036E9E188
MPEEIRAVPLDSLVSDKISYGIVQPGNLEADGVPIVRVKDVRNGKIDTSDPLVVSREVEQKYARTRLRGGEVLLTLVGSVGEVAVASEEVRGWNVARAIAVVRPSSEVTAQWLRLVLSSSAAQRYFSDRLNTTVQATLNLKDVRTLPVPMPSPRERDAVCAVVGALDDKIAVNERIATTAIELADAIYLQAVSGVEPGDETFGSVATVGGGGTPSTKVESYWGGDIAWTTPSDVTALPSPYLFNTGRKVTSEGLEMCASPLYPANSIFMTSRATIGAFALPQIPAAVNQGFIVVTPPGEPMRWWLFHEMRSRVPEMFSLCNGSTFLELSRKNFKDLKVRLPGADEIEKFARVAAPLHGRAVHAAEENHLLVETRDTLLPQLMSGRLRVKDAEKIVEDHV